MFVGIVDGVLLVAHLPLLVGAGGLVAVVLDRPAKVAISLYQI